MDYYRRSLYYQLLFPQPWIFRPPHLLLCVPNGPLGPLGVLWLQFQQSPQEAVGGDGKVVELSICMETVQSGVFRWKMSVYITVVTSVVRERGGQEARTQKELSFKL